MARKVSEIAAEVVDREAIRDLLARYSRGIDRIDKALIESVYWEDATDDHVDYVGSAAGFVKFIVPLLKRMDQTSHMTGNMLIEFHGGTAHAETYFTAFHRISSANGAASAIWIAWKDAVTSGESRIER